LALAAGKTIAEKKNKSSATQRVGFSGGPFAGDLYNRRKQKKGEKEIGGSNLFRKKGPAKNPRIVPEGGTGPKLQAKKKLLPIGGEAMFSKKKEEVIGLPVRGRRNTRRGGRRLRGRRRRGKGEVLVVEGERSSEKEGSLKDGISVERMEPILNIGP